MEIKQFIGITTPQRKELYNFIKSTDLTYNKTYIQMVNIYESDTVNYGNSVFILFHEGKIRGSVALITKEIIIREEAFITDVYIAKKNVQASLCFLIEKIVEYCKIYNSIKMKIGIRESEIYLIPYIEAMKFNHIYDAVIMRYCGEKNKVWKLSRDIVLQPLSILNSIEYMNIQNDAFRTSPNGGTIDEVEVKDYIVQYANHEDLIGLCYAQNKPCGIYELSTNEKIGWINILAVAPKSQNKGIGKILIGKCIQRLWEEDVDGIKLLVITSNNTAVNMYKENEFEEERIFSYWFEKQLEIIN